MTFQKCKTYVEFESLEDEVRNKFISGMSDYADSTFDGAETIAKEKLIMVFKGGNREHDRIRTLLKALNPEIYIMEEPHYDAETVNMCQSMNRIIVATKKQELINRLNLTPKNI